MEKRRVELKQPQLDKCNELAVKFSDTFRDIVNDRQTDQDQKRALLDELMLQSKSPNFKKADGALVLTTYAASLMNTMVFSTSTSSEEYINLLGNTVSRHLAELNLDYENIAAVAANLHDMLVVGEKMPPEQATVLRGIIASAQEDQEFVRRNVDESNEAKHKAESDRKQNRHQTIQDAADAVKDNAKNIAAGVANALKSQKSAAVAISALAIFTSLPAANASASDIPDMTDFTKISPRVINRAVEIVRTSDTTPFNSAEPEFGSPVPPMPKNPPVVHNSSEFGKKIDLGAGEDVNAAKSNAELETQLATRFSDEKLDAAADQANDEGREKGKELQLPTELVAPSNEDSAKTPEVQEPLFGTPERFEELPTAPERDPDAPIFSAPVAPTEPSVGEQTPTLPQPQPSAPGETDSSVNPADPSTPVETPPATQNPDDSEKGPTVLDVSTPPERGEVLTVPEPKVIEVPDQSEWSPKAMKNGTALMKKLQEKYGYDKSGELADGEVELVDPEIWGRHSLYPDAAAGMRAMNEAFNAEFGRNIEFTDSYRSIDVQKDLKERKPYLAATPGKSNHGWGFAVDFGSKDHQHTYNSKEYKWMQENAGKFGWVNPEWAQEFDQDGTPNKQESWHWEWIGIDAIDVTYATDSLADRQEAAAKKKAAEAKRNADEKRERERHENKDSNGSEKYSGSIDIRAAKEMAELSGEMGRAGKIMLYLLQNTTLTPGQASGMIGNFMHEAPGLKADTKQWSGGPGRGFVQWEIGYYANGAPKRGQDLIEFAQSRGTSWDDFDTQVAFVVHELKGKESGAYKKIKQAKVVSKAAFATRKYFERPAEATANDPQRTENALNVYAAYDKIRDQHKPKSAKNNGETVDRKKEKHLPGSELAVAWANYYTSNNNSITHKCGTKNCASMCARATAVLYGRSSAGGNANNLRDNAARRGDLHMSSKDIPVGALVHYKGSSKYQHIAVYVGNGEVATNMTVTQTYEKISLRRADQLFHFRGWSKPHFAGKPSKSYLNGPPGWVGTASSSIAPIERAVSMSEIITPDSNGDVLSTEVLSGEAQQNSDMAERKGPTATNGWLQIRQPEVAIREVDESVVHTDEATSGTVDEALDIEAPRESVPEISIEDSGVEVVEPPYVPSTNEATRQTDVLPGTADVSMNAQARHLVEEAEMNARAELLMAEAEKSARDSLEVQSVR
ncbi:MAG: phage tail tip lysozyme [Candidatus Saccharimonadales bacterium]